MSRKPCKSGRWQDSSRTAMHVRRRKSHRSNRYARVPSKAPSRPAPPATRYVGRPACRSMPTFRLTASGGVMGRLDYSVAAIKMPFQSAAGASAAKYPETLLVEVAESFEARAAATAPVERLARPAQSRARYRPASRRAALPGPGMRPSSRNRRRQQLPSHRGGGSAASGRAGKAGLVDEDDSNLRPGRRACGYGSASRARRFRDRETRPAPNRRDRASPRGRWTAPARLRGRMDKDW